MVYSPDGRILKNDVRAMIASVCGKNKRTAIMLPAAGAHDVALFLEQGIITNRTKVFAVERDADIAAQMWVSMFNLGMGRKTIRHVGELETLCVNEPIDLAFIDLCGPGLSPQMEWIEEKLIPHLTLDADVFITLKTNNRVYCCFAEAKAGLEQFPEFERERNYVWSHFLVAKTTLDGQKFGKAVTPQIADAVARHRVMFGQIFTSEYQINSVVYRDLDTNTGKTNGSREMHVLHIARPRILTWR